MFGTNTHWYKVVENYTNGAVGIKIPIYKYQYVNKNGHNDIYLYKI